MHALHVCCILVLIAVMSVDAVSPEAKNLRRDQYMMGFLPMWPYSWWPQCALSALHIVLKIAFDLISLWQLGVPLLGVAQEPCFGSFQSQ